MAIDFCWFFSSPAPPAVVVDPGTGTRETAALKGASKRYPALK
jgi:hypothetical protein